MRKQSSAPSLPRNFIVTGVALLIFSIVISRSMPVIEFLVFPTFWTGLFLFAFAFLLIFIGIVLAIVTAIAKNLGHRRKAASATTTSASKSSGPAEDEPIIVVEASASPAVSAATPK